jgi:hypothetical protein
MSRPGGPLDADTIRAYLSRVRQFLTWLVNAAVDGDPLNGLGVLVRKLPGAAIATIAAGYDTDRLPHWALSGVPKRCGGGALTRRYTTDCGSWQFPYQRPVLDKIHLSTTAKSQPSPIKSLWPLGVSLLGIDGQALDGALFVLFGGQAVPAGGFDGIVRLTGLGCSVPGVGGSDWVRGGHVVVVVQGAPVPGGDHQSLCVAVSPLFAEFAGGRRDDDGPQCHGHLRDYLSGPARQH